MHTASIRRFIPLVTVPRGLYIEIAAVVVILFIATFSRLYLLDTRPGWEIDEVVYFRIAENTSTYGFPAFKAEPGRPTVPYLSHPPFYFSILTNWYSLVGENTIYAGRLLSSMSAIISLGLVYMFLRTVVGRWAGLLSLLLLATDGWMIFTNRIGWIENSQLMLIVSAIWLYDWAQRREKVISFVLAGIAISSVLLYKHLGAYVLLMVLINWGLQRRWHREHLILLFVVAVCIGGYSAIMYNQWGQDFVAQYTNQLLRTIGVRESRGLNYGTDKIVQAVISRYWIFFTTIACFISGSVLSVIHVVRHLRNSQYQQTTLLSWCLAAMVAGIMLGLKSPHYFILWLVPFYCLIGCEIARIRVSVGLIIGLIVVVQLNALTWNWRFIERDDNLLLDTQLFALEHLPSDAIVVSEQAVCAVISQPCARFENYQTSTKIDQLGAQYIFPYISTTQQPPNELIPLLATMTKLGEATGFKDYIEFRKR